MGMDDYKGLVTGLNSPARQGFEVTPHDSNELAHYSRAIFVGVGGVIKVTTSGGDTISLIAPAGAILPIVAKLIHSTGTTATGIVVFW